MQKVRIATRGSDLAILQARAISRLFTESSIESEIITTKTLGDIDHTTPIYSMNGNGVFVSSLNMAILDGEADLAVHSAKDMPSSTDSGLEIAYYSERGDPRDYFVSNVPIHDFRGTIGTSSVRRKAFISLLNTNINFTSIRGNIQTRIDKFNSGVVDATVVAKVALDRLHIEPRGYVFSEEEVPPDPNQGFIAVVSRKESPFARFLRKFQSEVSLWEASSERLIMSALGLGCDSPISIRAKFETKTVNFSTVIDKLRVDRCLKFSDSEAIKEAVVSIGDILGTR